MTAIAAALLAMIGVQVVFAGLVCRASAASRRRRWSRSSHAAPTPAPTPSIVPSAQYVALLQGAAGGPAFILTVDGATKNFTVRKVGAPPIDAEQELRALADLRQTAEPAAFARRDRHDRLHRAARCSRATTADVVNSATYAVTVEQSGGSPDGAPHSQPVFIGKLIETVPAAPAPAQNR